MRAYVFSHALLFVAGFTFVFVVVFGLPTTVLGALLYDYRDWMTAVGGVLIIVLGLHMAGAFKALARLAGQTGPLHAALARLDATLDAIILPERRLQIDQDRSPGYIRSALIGVTFAAGWTPCVGPLLGLVLSLASTEPARAFFLLLVYSLGLAVPFLLTAALLGTATGFLRRINRYLHVIELVSGLLLVVVGVFLVGGIFSYINILFSATPSWTTTFEDSLANSTISVPLAFIAGLLSFLSPCVLPLVPIYLGYLGGTALGNPERQPAEDWTVEKIS